MRCGSPALRVIEERGEAVRRGLGEADVAWAHQIKKRTSTIKIIIRQANMAKPAQVGAQTGEA